MNCLWVKTINGGNQFFVIDFDIKDLIKKTLIKHNNKKILYCTESANDDDIESYGGIADEFLVEYVIESCCLLDCYYEKVDR